jgi:hypothetical protein
VVGLIFIFCSPGLVFGGIWCDVSRFHFLRSRTRFRRYGGRRVLFSCYARLDSFSAILRESDLVFLFCAPRLIFDGAECVGSRFKVLRSRTRFSLYRGRQVMFSWFDLLNSFSAVRRVTSPVFMFCAPGLVFSGIEGIKSCFHVLHSWAHFQRYGGRRVLISCFALPDSFSAVPRASGPIFRFCAPGLVFGRTMGVRSNLNVFSALTHFRRYRVRRVPFSSFARPDSFLAVPRATGPVLLF